MQKTARRLLALLLCAALAVGLLPAMAAGLVYFPEFSAEVGGNMEPDDPWPAIGSSAVPSQTYFQSGDDWDNCLFLAKDYIDLLEDTGDFEVVSPLKVVYGKEGSDEVQYSCALRYTGSAPMKGTLKALRADKTWPDYGEYHIAVRAERDASRPNPARRNSVIVRWDSALRPEGIDFYAGEDTEDHDEPDTGTTTPDTGSTKPDTGTTTPDTGNTVGNSDNTFQSLDSAMGYYLTCSDEGLYYEDTSKDPLSYTELLQAAEEYVDLLVGEDNFYLVPSQRDRATRRDTSWSDGKCSSWFIRYTGTAPMEENLAAGDYIDWNNYGPYHLKVQVWDSGKRYYITVAWDNGLQPVESNRRTPMGAKLGSAERPPEQVTAVLGIGYNKMCVNNDVVQVDTQNANVYPVAENNRTLVPVSRIVEAFGGESTWDAKTNNTTYTLGNCTVSHVIGSKDVIIQKGSQRQKKTMEVPSKAMNNRTYVPVRYVLEGLGLWVGYEPTYQLVIVSNESKQGEDLVELAESQRLFASEEIPKTARKYLEQYTIDGFNYTMEVGESLTLYNSQKPISTYYAYSWDVLDGGELVKVDREDATCRFYAKRPGVVTIRAYLDQTVQGTSLSSDLFNSAYTMTITITPATNQGSAGGLMHWGPCPSCNGTGKIRSGTREITCPTCLGQKQILQ